MIESRISVVNKLGLHARASSRLAQLAGRFSSEIKIGKDASNLVDGKSIMGLMLLAAGAGSELLLRVDGKDEQEATRQIKQIFADKFDEDE